METINDIVAEMREFADADSQSIGRDVLRRRIQHFADRIEKAVTNCNQSKMREALEDSNGLLEELALIGEWSESAKGQITENKAALSAPSRNCDRFNDPGEALSVYCEDKGITHPLLLWFGNEFWGLLQWLFAEAKGDAK